MTKIKRYKSVRDFRKDVLDLDDYESWLITFKNSLKSIIITKRKELKLSQNDLANLLGTTQSVVSRLEAGLSKNITIDYLFKVIIVLGMRPEEAMKNVA